MRHKSAHQDSASQVLIVANDDGSKLLGLGLPSHGQTRSTQVWYLYLLMVDGYEYAFWPMQ